jgi:hypothetical protein
MGVFRKWLLSYFIARPAFHFVCNGLGCLNNGRATVNRLDHLQPDIYIKSYIFFQK